MRRSLLLAIVLLMTLSAPVAAQLFPTTGGGSEQPAPPSERVLIDTTVYVNPPADQGLCMVIGAGHLTITARRVSDPIEQRPTSFRLLGFMADPDANVTMTISGAETSTTITVNGADRYCWSISVDAPETQGMSNAQRGAYVQRVAIRMTLAP